MNGESELACIVQDQEMEEGRRKILKKKIILLIPPFLQIKHNISIKILIKSINVC